MTDGSSPPLAASPLPAPPFCMSPTSSGPGRPCQPTRTAPRSPCHPPTGSIRTRHRRRRPRSPLRTRTRRPQRSRTPGRACGRLPSADRAQPSAGRQVAPSRRPCAPMVLGSCLNRRRGQGQALSSLAMAAGASGRSVAAQGRAASGATAAGAVKRAFPSDGASHG